MKTIFFNWIKKHIFVYTTDGLYPLDPHEGSEPLAKEQLPRFAFVVLGRDNYQEVERTYPVINPSDLNAILKNELSGSWLASKPEVDGTQTKLKFWIPNESTNQFIRDSRVMWIPETLLLQLGMGEGFFEFSRFGGTLYFVNSDEKSVSSMAIGAYKNASYFLLSAGVENDYSHKAIDTAGYRDALKAGIGKVKGQTALQVLRSQNTLHYIKNLFHWPSAIGGAMVAILAVTLLQLGWQKMRISSLEEQAATQDVRSIIALEKRVQIKKELLQSLSAGDDSSKGSYRLWRLLADVMENNITVIEFSQQNGRNLFRLQSDSAIDALEMIRSLPYTSNADFTNSVQNSRGKERYTIGLDFNSELAE